MAMDHLKFIKIYYDVSSRADIGCAAKIIHGYIGTYLEIGDGRSPSIREIAQDCGTGRTTVTSAIKELEAAMASAALEALGPTELRRRLNAWLGLSAFAPIRSRAPALAHA